MKRVLSLFAFALVVILPAFSQVTTEVPRFDVSAGFSHTTGDIGMNGWDASGTYRASPWLGLVADFSGTYGTDTVLGVDFKSNLHNFLFGPRIFVPLNNYPNWKPFGELLLGASRENQTIEPSIVAPGVAVPGVSKTDTAFAWMLGGGLDYQFHPQFRVRLIQVDLLRTNFFDTGQSRARIGFGLVYQFGR
jgi:opacity protein-like surface antigen